MLPQPGKHGQFRSGLGQKGARASPPPPLLLLLQCMLLPAAAGTCRCASFCRACCAAANPASAPADLPPLSAPSALHPALPAGLAIFLNSLGELTAYDSDGDMLWQVGHALWMHACKPCGSQLATRRAMHAPWQPSLPCASLSPPLPRPPIPPPSALPLPLQHSVGTTWAEPDDEDVPAAAPTLRAMALRPRAVPTVILAGGGWVGRGSSVAAQSCVLLFCSQSAVVRRVAHLFAAPLRLSPPRCLPLPQVARTAPLWCLSRGTRSTHSSCQTHQPCPFRCAVTLLPPRWTSGLINAPLRTAACPSSALSRPRSAARRLQL